MVIFPLRSVEIHTYMYTGPALGAAGPNCRALRCSYYGKHSKNTKWHLFVGVTTSLYTTLIYYGASSYRVDYPSTGHGDPLGVGSNWEKLVQLA